MYFSYVFPIMLCVYFAPYQASFRTKNIRKLNKSSWQRDYLLVCVMHHFFSVRTQCIQSMFTVLMTSFHRSWKLGTPTHGTLANQDYLDFILMVQDRVSFYTSSYHRHLKIRHSNRYCLAVIKPLTHSLIDASGKLAVS